MRRSLCVQVFCVHNGKVCIMKNISDGFAGDDDSYRIDLSASDVNGDGRVNNKDLGLLQQYVNEWDVELG